MYSLNQRACHLRQVQYISIDMMNRMPLIVSCLVCSQISAFANEETRLLSVPSMEGWKPPVEVEKVLEPKQVIQREVVVEKGRLVSVDKCAPEAVTKTPQPKVESRAEQVVSDDSVSDYLPPIMVGVSATVYKEGEKVFTRLRVTCGKDTCEAWSNIDFNYFRGVLFYIANGREYYQVGGYGSEEGFTASEKGCPVDAPEMAAGKFGFVMADGSKVDETNVAYIALYDMHKLYEVEKDTLHASYKVRLENMKKAEEWRKANPPQPKDITVQFWKREIKEEDK